MYVCLRSATPIYAHDLHRTENRNIWISINHRPIPPFLLKKINDLQRILSTSARQSSSHDQWWLCDARRTWKLPPCALNPRVPQEDAWGWDMVDAFPRKNHPGKKAPRTFQMVKSKVSGWFSPIVNPFFHKTPRRKRIAVAEGPRHGAAVQSIWSLTCNCGCWFHTCLFSILFGMITKSQLTNMFQECWHHQVIVIA